MINIPPELLTNARMHYTYLHEHPELSFAEEQTAAYIRRTLDCLQIQYTNAGPTGIIGFNIMTALRDYEGHVRAAVPGQLPYGQTSTPCRSPKRKIILLFPVTRALCMPVGTICTRPSYWERQKYWPPGHCPLT